MKSLSRNQWIAIIVAIVVIGYFFIVPLFKSNENNSQNQMNTTDQNSEQSNSDLVMEDIVVGTGLEAKSGMLISVHYTGTFTDGSVFDSSVNREPFEFILGAGQVIQGWDQGFAGMKVGGKRKLVIPPQLGYGASDRGPIPGNSTLIFEVELLDVRPLQ